MILSTIIVCCLVITIMVIVHDSKLSKVEKRSRELLKNNMELRKSYLELASMADELADESMILVEILEDNFTPEHIDELVAEKKRQKEPQSIEELNKFLKQKIAGER